ncbi:MAG: methyltransferase [Planctomycetota bacterium]
MSRGGKGRRLARGPAKRRPATPRTRPQKVAESPARRGPSRVERVLVDVLDQIRGRRVVTVTHGAGRFAIEAAKARDDRTVDCVSLDAFLASRCLDEAENLAADDVDGRPRLRVLCQPDLPTENYDVAVVPAPAGTEAELTRDWLQQAYSRLVDRGRLIAATDGDKDHGLRREFEKYCPNPTRIASSDGVVLLGTKLGDGPKPKSFDAEFPANVAGQPLRVATRPGVFSHRDVDQAARALAESLPEDADLPPGATLDLGCGSGVIAFVMTRVYPGRDVVAADSNPRALEAVGRGVSLNGLRPIETVLTADARVPGAGRFALVAGNPPYFSDFRIATLFLDSAAEAIRPGGVVLMVTKRPEWFLNEMSARFDGVDGVPMRNYGVMWGFGRGAD